MDRRDFLRAGLGGVGAALVQGACKPGSPPAPDSDAAPADAALTDRAPPERGAPDRPSDRTAPQLVFQGYQGLADLPYFDLDSHGELVCTVKDLPDIIDIHTHFGFAYALAPKIDLGADPGQVKFLVDCDGASPPCRLDLDQYVNLCATPEMLKQMNAEIAASLLPGGSTAAKTQTIPRLLAEMDRMQIKKAVVLPISLGLPIGDNATSLWLSAIQQANALDRLIPFGSVHPGDRNARSKIAGFKKLGLRGLKVHPPMQRRFADDDSFLPLYEECAQQRLPVFFHAGRSGIDPKLTAKYGLIDHYLKPVAELPSVSFVLGHAGCRLDPVGALAIAKAHKNVWLDVHGQGVSWLRHLIEELGPERLLAGSDWPFYPEAVQLAKVLIVTEGDKKVRDLLLHDNAEALLAGA
jgi:uncharacterized protein